MTPIERVVQSLSEAVMLSAGAKPGSELAKLEQIWANKAREALAAYQEWNRETFRLGDKVKILKDEFGWCCPRGSITEIVGFVGDAVLVKGEVSAGSEVGWCMLRNEIEKIS